MTENPHHIFGWRRRTVLLGLSAFCIAVFAVLLPSQLDDDDALGIATTKPSESDAAPPTVSEPVGPPPLPMSWTEVNEPGVGGRLTSLAFDPSDPQNLLAGGDLLGIARSINGGQTWESTVGLENPEVGDISFDPDTPGRVWAGTMGGPHVSDDGGTTWRLERNGMPTTDVDGYSAPIEAVLFDPNNSDRLIAIGGSQRLWVAPGEPAFGAIWESLDDGANWRRLSDVADANIQAGAFFAGPESRMIVAVEDEGIFVSDDGGSSWTSTNGGLPHLDASDVATHPSDPNRAWITLRSGDLQGDTFEPGGVYRSDDGGQSWALSGSGLTQFEWEDTLLTSSYEAIVVSPSDPDRLYTADFSFRENFIYRSDDGGSTWLPVIGDELPLVRAYSSGVTAREIAVDPTDPDRFMFGQDEFIMASTDGGATARDITTDVTTGGAYIGRGFSGLVANAVVFNPFVPDDVTLLGFDGANHIQTIDGFATYRRSLRDEDDYGGATRGVHADEGSTVFLLLGQDNDFRGVGRSFDGGESFEIAVGSGAGLPERSADVDETGLAVDPADSSQVYVVLNGTLLQSTDKGETFSPALDRSDVFDVAFDPSSGDLFLSTDVGLLVSSDGAGSFTAIEGSPSDLRRISFEPTSPDTLLVISGDVETAVHRFDRSGTQSTWNELFRTDYLRQVAAHPSQPGAVVAVTQDLPFRDIVASTGVWVTVDDGATWFQSNEGLPMLRASAVAFDPHRPDQIVVGLYGRGFYRASFEAISSASAS